MTESLFFSQIATKSIDAKKITSSASAKMFRSDAGGFDKHLSLPDRGDRRGRGTDHLNDERREPTFTKKRQAPENTRAERSEPQKRPEKAGSREEKAKPQAQDKAKESDSSSARKTTEAQDDSNPKAQETQSQNSQTDENGAPKLELVSQTSPEQQAFTLLEGETEEVALEDLVALTDETLETGTTAENSDETAQVIPLFSEETTEKNEQVKSPELIAASLNTTTITGTQQAEAAVKQTQKKTGENPATQILDAKQTTDGSKPGLETALARMQENKPGQEAKPILGEVTQVTKHASYLGEVNIEDAQRSDKTDIKARISELAQKTSAGPVSTSAPSKAAANISQLATAKIEGAGPLQPLNTDTQLTNIQNNHTVHVRFGSLPQATQNAQIPVTTIAFHIAKSVENGVNRFEIRIDPPELGRVDVKLEVGQNGRVIANLAVERPETLDLLQRDQRALERALQDAGLDVGGQSLNFSLKDQSADSSKSSDLDNAQIASNAEAEEELIEPEMITGYVTNSGVDIRI